jgi:hypothetical protein
MAIWAVFMLMMMLMAGSLGIDLMLAESRRAAAQSTLDRAVLAAADLDQTINPEQVVRSYMANAGLEEYVTGVEVTEGLNFRNVQASVSMEQDTLLMGMLGVGTLPIVANATAEEAVSEVEVSLVLDISGSMGSNQRLPRLKDASEEFVDILLDSAEPGAISLSVVPYATQVSVGETLLDQFTVSQEHGHSHCVNFADDVFDDTEIRTDEPLERTAHFDPFSPYTWGRGPFREVCRSEPESEVLAFAQDRATLMDRIDGLTADGNTSIDIGVKWGAALLDPSTRPAIDALVGSGDIDAAFAGRPRDLDEPEVLKVLVVMTDGENTTLFEKRDEFRSGPSDFWIDPSSNQLSFETIVEGEESCGWQRQSGRWRWICVQEDDTTAYYIPHRDEWRSTPWGGSDAYRLDYADLWGETSVGYHAYMRYLATRNANDYYAWDNETYDAVSFQTKDDRLSRVCRAARDAGIVIYTVGFEVSDRSAGVLQDCASSPGHFFRVEGLEISNAFTAIARQVRQVRLVE